MRPLFIEITWSLVSCDKMSLFMVSAASPKVLFTDSKVEIKSSKWFSAFKMPAAASVLVAAASLPASAAAV